MRSGHLAFIGVLASVPCLAIGCGWTPGPGSAGAPPIVIAPSAVLLRTPNLVGHNCFEVSVAFSPDGRTVAAGRVECSRSGGGEASCGTVVSLCEVASGRERATIREALGEASGSLAFSADGRTLAVGLERSAKLFDPETGRERAELTTDFSFGPSCLAFSPDGRRLAATTMLGELVVWDLGPGRQAARTDLQTQSAEGVAVSPDGKLVATASQGGGRLPELLEPVRVGRRLRAGSGGRPGLRPANRGAAGPVRARLSGPVGVVLARRQDPGVGGRGRQALGPEHGRGKHDHRGVRRPRRLRRCVLARRGHPGRRAGQSRVLGDGRGGPALGRRRAPGPGRAPGRDGQGPVAGVQPGRPGAGHGERHGHRPLGDGRVEDQSATWRIIASSFVKSMGLVMWVVNPASRLRRTSSSMP